MTFTLQFLLKKLKYGEKMVGILITISGIDGSGKTTISRDLVAELNKIGIKCKYEYGKLDPKITRFLIKLGRTLFLRKKNPYKNYHEYSETKRQVIKKRGFLAKIYFSILLLEYKISIFLRISTNLRFGKLVICDRYVFDTVISDLAPDLGLSKEETVLRIQKMLKKLPKPNLAFLIDVPEEVALNRKKDIPSKEYLAERRNLYLYVASKFNMEVLDGTKELGEIKCHIMEKVRKFYQ